MDESVGWEGTEGSGWTWPLDPRSRASWATLEQSELFSCTGNPLALPPH